MNSISNAGLTFDVYIHSLTVEAEDIYSLDLRRPDGGTLPEFTAGAHLRVLLPNGLERSYSLINPQDEIGRYVIAVARDAKSRGGSSFICETLRPGEILKIIPPTNTFQLIEGGASSVLLAGGIGVTPIWSMVQRLVVINKSWKLFYAVRTRKKAAFLSQLESLGTQNPGRVVITFDHEPGREPLNLSAIVRSEPAGTHFYCCGPTGMLKDFESATDHLDPEFVHKEVFSNMIEGASKEFFVVLAKSGKSYRVDGGKSILSVLQDAGHNVAFSCKEGVCGTCETEVIEGIPDHRDAFLTKRERDSNRVMMICCSRSKTERIVLQL
jgi:tetrachlorobenzoquinone reductase